MDNLFGFVEAFYSRFLLRDLLAKIVPGACVFVYLLHRADGLLWLRNLSFITGVFIVAACWIFGFAVQGLGEIFKLIKYHVDSDASERYTRFVKCSEEVLHKDVERIVVIKEACGNAYVSFLLILLSSIAEQLIGYYYYGEPLIIMNLKYIPVFMLCGLIVFSLRYMHIEHVKRQDQVVRDFLPDEVIEDENVKE